MKAPRVLENTIDEFLRDAVALQVEKADRSADVSQLAGGRLATSLPAAKVWRNVERGYFFVRVRMVHQVDGFVIIPDDTPYIMGFSIMRFQLFHRSCSSCLRCWSQGAGSQKAGSAVSITLTWRPMPVNGIVILSDNVQWARMN